MSPSASPVNQAHLPKPSSQDLAALGQKLIRSAKDGRLDEVRDILDLGASVNARDNRDWTALMWAAWRGHVSVGTLLLDRGAGIGLKKDDGKTALDLAKDQGHRGMVKLLRSRGALETELDGKLWWGFCWAFVLYIASGGLLMLIWIPLLLIVVVVVALREHPVFYLFAALLLLAFLVILRRWDKS